MDMRKIAQLAQLMSKHDLTEVSIENADVKLLLKRGRAVEPAGAQLPAVVPALAGVLAPVPAPAGTVAAKSSFAAITSPIVGTFYVAPAPDVPAFVKVGDRVGPDTVVCIVEAMKVMNEVKAETSGVIRRVLVDNGTPVEFGQPLFEVEPS